MKTEGRTTTMQEQQNYGAYTGSPQYDGPPQQYSTPPQSQNVPPMYDDAFMDALAQRLSQRMTQGPQGKIYPQGQYRNRASAGQRLALAIVSIAILVPILGVITGLIGGMAAFCAAALLIILVNVVFNLNG